MEGRAEDRMKYWLETREEEKKIVTQQRSGYPQCLYFLVLEYYTTRDNLTEQAIIPSENAKMGALNLKKIELILFIAAAYTTMSHLLLKTLTYNLKRNS